MTNLLFLFFYVPPWNRRSLCGLFAPMFHISRPHLSLLLLLIWPLGPDYRQSSTGSTIPRGASAPPFGTDDIPGHLSSRLKQFDPAVSNRI
jgi:hypothetical protein